MILEKLLQDQPQISCKKLYKNHDLARLVRRYWSLVPVLAMSILQACAIANPKGGQYAPDNTITGALAPVGEKINDETLEKDGRIIRDQVIQAAFFTADDQNNVTNGVRWENDHTGSRGTISHIQPIRQDDRNCRAFKTTRESFDGVMIYEGQACETPSGWILSRFDAQ